MSKTLRIFTEITPNPRTLKFVTNQVLLPVGSADFPIAQAAGDATLPKALFEVPGVESVFICGDFVTISKRDDATWETVVPGVSEAMAKVNTYTEDPGALINWLLQGRENLHGMDRLAVNFLFLFVRTPANILRRGVGLTAQPFTGHP